MSSSRVFGWSPPHDEDYVDLHLTSNTSDTTQSASDASRQPQASSTSSSTSRIQDPGWVARPRNEFILFRCEFVRNHSREAKRSRKSPSHEPDSKSLSKQAAEAWYHLSPEERLSWKERANRERREHARRYPNYQYRPRKSATSSSSRSSRSLPGQRTIMPSYPMKDKMENRSVTSSSQPTSPSTAGSSEGTYPFTFVASLSNPPQGQSRPEMLTSPTPSSSSRPVPVDVLELINKPCIPLVSARFQRPQVGFHDPTPLHGPSTWPLSQISPPMTYMHPPDLPPDQWNSTNSYCRTDFHAGSSIGFPAVVIGQQLEDPTASGTGRAGPFANATYVLDDSNPTQVSSSQPADSVQAFGTDPLGYNFMTMDTHNFSPQP